MKWSDLPTDPSKKILRQFAGASLVFLLAAGISQFAIKSREGLGLCLSVVGLLIGTAGWMRPTSLRWLFVGAMTLAFPLGWLVSQLTLALVFYGVMTPMALLFRLMGRDALSRRFRPDMESYWLPKEPTRDPRRYFRPY